MTNFQSMGIRRGLAIHVNLFTNYFINVHSAEECNGLKTRTETVSNERFQITLFLFYLFFFKCNFSRSNYNQNSIKITMECAMHDLHFRHLACISENIGDETPLLDAVVYSIYKP